MDILFILVAIAAVIAAFFIGWKVAIHPDTVHNEEELQRKKELEIEIKTKQEQVATLKTEQDRLNKQYQETQRYIKDAESSAQKIYESKNKELELKYKQDKEELDKKLKAKEDVFNLNFKKAEDDFSKRQEEYAAEIEKVKEELNSFKATKAAAIEAARKEKLISQKQEEYCLRIPIEEQNDIAILKSVRNRITKPRAVSTVIWSAYFQPLAKKLFPQILGTTEVCGIYKITNQETGECYIGQAKDCRKRWNEHCRCGVGIDTPQGNKLYKAMQDYGLESFSFELLEECPSDRLNEKEKYFINLYSSDTLGYNGNAGIGK